jgi:hypothetical protein
MTSNVVSVSVSGRSIGEDAPKPKPKPKRQRVEADRRYREKKKQKVEPLKDVEPDVAPPTVEQRELKLWQEGVCPAPAAQLEGLPEHVKCKWVAEPYALVQGEVWSLVCSICRVRPLLPHTTGCQSCGQLLCGDCVQRCGSCPMCKHGGRPSARNALFESLFQDYPVHCPSGTCNQLVPYKEALYHVRTCPPLSKCPMPNCDELVRYHDLQSHLSEHHHMVPSTEEGFQLTIGPLDGYRAAPFTRNSLHEVNGDVLLVRVQLDVDQLCLLFKVRSLYRASGMAAKMVNLRFDIETREDPPSCIQALIPLRQYCSSADRTLDAILPAIPTSHPYTLEIRFAPAGP